MTLIEQPDILINHLGMEMDEVVALQTEWRSFLDELSKEWPPARVYEYLLKKKREKYKFTKEYIEGLERKNYEARIAGMSFKERQKRFVSKIPQGTNALVILQKEGEELKRKHYQYQKNPTDLHAAGIINPWNMQEIKNWGMEKYLDIYYVF